MKKSLKESGITLVALLITVIIMLILAGVAILTLTSDGGLFDKTKQAVEKYENAAQSEADMLNNLNELLSGNYTGSGGGTDTELLNIISNLVSRVEALENQGTGNILEAYPVGSIYLSTNETSPADLFGGTWEAYGQGRTLVGVGTGEDTRGEQLEFLINQTGGEYKHALSVEEMPSHNHTLTAVTGTASTTASYVTRSSNGSNSGTISIPSNTGDVGPTNYNFSPKTVLTSASSSSKTTSSSGSSSAHNIMQPYIACYMWKRIS